MKVFWLSLLLCLVSLPAFSQVPTITWLGNGWLIKATYKNPSPIGGTAATINADVTYEVDGVLQTATATDTLTLPVPVSTTKKIWTSKLAMNSQYTITGVTGDGTAVFDTNGKLNFNVTAPNDGAIHTIQFKLMLIIPPN